MIANMFKAAQDWQRASFQGMQMMLSAGAVIQIRTMQMGLGIMNPAEAARMVFEKPVAFAKSAELTSRALAANKGFAAASIAGMRPLGTATRANQRRLMKGGSTRS